MSQRRLYTEHALAAGAGCIVDGDAARYLGRVLRLRPADEVVLFNGRDGAYRARIDRLGRNEVSLTVIEPVATATESPLAVCLVQGISRGDRMDHVVQKATELGVQRITPVLTDHGVVRLDTARAARRREHWRNIAISAAEQCGRIAPPRIDHPLALNDWFGAEAAGAGARVVLAPGADTPFASLPAPDGDLLLLIGPEGGFSDRELADAGVAGFTAAAFGPRVLRTETAAVAALTAAGILWGDLGDPA